MWFRTDGIHDVQEGLRNLEEEVRRVVRRVDSLCEDKERRTARRDFYIVKLLPAIALTIAALGTLNAVFHWT